MFPDRSYYAYLALFSWLLILSACAHKPFQMANKDKFVLGPSEGVVFGSVMVEAMEPKNDSFWQTFLKGRKGSVFKYKFLIYNKEDTWDRYKIIVTPNEEIHFVVNLTSGDYKISKLVVMPDQYSDYLKANINVYFSVKPKQYIYIGKLIISLPERVKDSSVISLRVEDDQIKALANVKQEYGIDENTIVKQLMYSP